MFDVYVELEAGAYTQGEIKQGGIEKNWRWLDATSLWYQVPYGLQQARLRQPSPLILRSLVSASALSIKVLRVIYSNGRPIQSNSLIR